MSNEIQLKNFLNNNNIKVQSVKYSNTLGVDCYLIYTWRKYNVNYLRKQLGNIEISKVPKLQGECGDVLIIKAKDGHKLLKGCNFNFLDALGESNREELIKKQLIINGTGQANTRVHFVKGKLILLYNTLYSSTAIANSLNICNDAVVDVSANGCGDLKMIVLLDRVDNPWVNETIPRIKLCEYEFDLKKDALDMPYPRNCIRKQLEKNCIDCGVINMSSGNIIQIGTVAETDDIATALNIPTESVIDLVDKKYILLDRV